MRMSRTLVGWSYSRLQLNVGDLSLGRCHLVNAYEVKEVQSNLQIKR